MLANICNTGKHLQTSVNIWCWVLTLSDSECKLWWLLTDFECLVMLGVEWYCVLSDVEFWVMLNVECFDMWVLSDAECWYMLSVKWYWMILSVKCCWVFQKHLQTLANTYKHWKWLHYVQTLTNTCKHLQDLQLLQSLSNNCNLVQTCEKSCKHLQNCVKDTLKLRMWLLSPGQMFTGQM